MKEGDTISEYFARVMVLVIMRNLGEEMPDAKRVEMIVKTLEEEFASVVCGIEELNVIKEHAVKVEGRWKSSGGREAKGEEDTKWSAGMFLMRNRSGVVGRTNNSLFFTWKEVRMVLSEVMRIWEKRANYAEIDEEEELLLMAQTEIKEAENEEIWFLDSGCSNHMTGKCLKVEEEENAEKDENGGDGGASGEDGGALEDGEKRSCCQNLSNDAENAEVCDNLPSPEVQHKRSRRAPISMKDYVRGEGSGEEKAEAEMALTLSLSHDDPVPFAETCKKEKWLEAMRCELQTIEKNETWDLVSSPVDAKKMEAMRREVQAIEKNETWKLVNLLVNAKKIGVKWVFKTKFNEDGNVDKLKARLVVKIYAQKEGTGEEFMEKPREEHILAAKRVLRYLKGTFDSRRTKHIDVRYHYLCDLAKQEAEKLVFCGTEGQVADNMTNHVKVETFNK